MKASGYEEREPISLSAAEVEHLASWCAEPRLIVFAALSGLRLGEVLAMRDDDINFEDGFRPRKAFGAPRRGGGHSDQYGRPDPTLVWKRYGHRYPGSTREAVAAPDQHLKRLRPE